MTAPVARTFAAASAASPQEPAPPPPAPITSDHRLCGSGRPDAEHAGGGVGGVRSRGLTASVISDPSTHSFKLSPHHSTAAAVTAMPAGSLPGSSQAAQDLVLSGRASFEAGHSPGRGSVAYLPYKSLGGMAVDWYAKEPSATGNMSILSAERYNDLSAALSGYRAGVRGEQMQLERPTIFGISRSTRDPDENAAPEHALTTTTRKHKMPSEGPSDSPTEPPPMIKRKKAERSPNEDGAVKKRPGRPRKDSPDRSEDAKERRRAQIRIAQRTYRQKKDDTILRLEQEVQRLKGQNQEMNAVFANLHQVACHNGLFSREPEFVRHLQRAMEQVTATSVAETSKANSPTDANRAFSTDEEAISNIAATSLAEATPIATIESPLHLDQQMLEPWGFRSSQHPPPETLHGELSMSFPDDAALGPSDRQVISLATPYNASFSFDINPDPNPLDVAFPNMPLDMTWDLPMYNMEPPPTFAHSEITFGRRLQRMALENGYRLLTSPNGDPARIERVFGFCLNFHPRDKIIARLRSALASGVGDDLNEWRNPFVNLGGSGTHYSMPDSYAGSAVPKFNTGQSMGPFSADVEQARDSHVRDDLRLSLPGFQGDFFDPNDVEGYLRGHGIDVIPNAEHVLVTREVYSRYTAKGANRSGRPAPASRSQSLAAAKKALVPGSMDFLLDGNTPTMDLNNWTVQIGLSDASRPSARQPANISPGVAFDRPPHVRSHAGNRAQYQSEAITISVETLLAELLKNTVCLGRSPGYRLVDIEAAIGNTIRAAVEAS